MTTCRGRKLHSMHMEFDEEVPCSRLSNLALEKHPFFRLWC